MSDEDTSWWNAIGCLVFCVVAAALCFGCVGGCTWGLCKLIVKIGR